MFDDRARSDLHFRTPEPPLLTEEPGAAAAGEPPRLDVAAPSRRTRTGAPASTRAAPTPSAAPTPGVAPVAFVDDDLPTSFFRRRPARAASTSRAAKERSHAREREPVRADEGVARPSADPGAHGRRRALDRDTRPVEVVARERRAPAARADAGASTVLLPSSDAPAAPVDLGDDGTVILPGRAPSSHVDAVTEPGRPRASARRIDHAAELRRLLEALMQRRGALAAAVGVTAIAALTCALTRGDDPGALPELLARARWILIAAGGAGGG